MRIKQKDVDGYVKKLCSSKKEIDSKEEMLSILNEPLSRDQTERVWKRYLFVFMKKI